MGLHPFRDPAVAEDVVAVRLPLDVAELHTYAVDWTPERADSRVDGALVRSTARPPWYPVQVVLGVFDSPGRSVGDDDQLVPELAVDWIGGSAGPLPHAPGAPG